MTCGRALAAGAALVLLAAPAALADDRSLDQRFAAVEARELVVEDIALTVEDIDLPEARDVIRPTTQPNVTVLDTDILFAFGEASLPSAAQAKLVSLASQIPDGSAVTVAGHTDSIGTDEANQALSLARAQAVANVLKGAKPSLVLTVTGFGEGKPISDNGTPEHDNPEGRALNRRVEITTGT